MVMMRGRDVRVRGACTHASGSDRTRPAILFLWDQLFEAEWECDRIEEHSLGEIQKLEERLKELEARSIQDPHKIATSLREKGDLPPGGQPGHAGHFREQTGDPDEKRIYPVNECARCGRRLKPLPVIRHEVRQVIDTRSGKSTSPSTAPR
jgi:hypothetical protein